MKKKTLITIAVYNNNDGDLYTEVLGLFDKIPSDSLVKNMVMNYISDNYSIEKTDNYDEFIDNAMSDGIIVSNIQYIEL